MSAPKFSVIIAAAGRGERFGKERKTLAKLGGRPIFLRSIELFVNRDDVCQTILVVPREDVDEIKTSFGPNLALMGVTLVEGGEKRMDSVAAGLKVVSEDAQLVAVHDAVRPCAPPWLIDAVVSEAGKTGAAIPACPLHGTIKRVSSEGFIEATVPREALFEAQTPQVFRRDLIQAVYADLPDGADQATDDAQLLEEAGHAVAIVKSDATNIKITTKADITLANAILKSRPAPAAKKFGAFEEAQW